MTIRQPVKGAAAFAKTIAVLQLVANSDHPLTSGQLVKLTGMPRPTMRRILKALIAEDMVAFRQDKTYVLGARNIELARRAIDQNSLLQTVNEDLVQLSQESKIPVHLGIPVGNEFVFIARTGDDIVPNGLVPIGVLGPYHACAVAKSYLAYALPNRREQILSSIELPALTQYTTTNVDELRSELMQIPTNGYVISRQETKLEVTSIGTCIMDADEMPCGSIGFCLPVSELDQQRESKLVLQLTQCRDRINQKLKQTNYQDPGQSS